MKIAAKSLRPKRQILENLKSLIVKIADVEDVKKIVTEGLRFDIDPNDIVYVERSFR